MKTRQKALEWWNNLSNIEKGGYAHYYLTQERKFQTLTGREIQNIFLLELAKIAEDCNNGWLPSF